MKLRLDKSGRIVLPKPLRQRLGIESWDNLRGHGSCRGGYASPHPRRPALVERDGFLVHNRQATRGFDWQELVDDLEQERLRDILGQ